MSSSHWISDLYFKSLGYQSSSWRAVPAEWGCKNSLCTPTVSICSSWYHAQSTSGSCQQCAAGNWFKAPRCCWLPSCCHLWVDLKQKIEDEGHGFESLSRQSFSHQDSIVLVVRVVVITGDIFQERDALVDVPRVRIQAVLAEFLLKCKIMPRE